jgi:hypothetical protein
MSANFTSDNKVTISLAPVAAGTTDQTGTGIFMGGPDGFDSVIFVYWLGTITSGAVTSAKAQQSSDDGSGDDYTDLAGSSQTIADTKSGKIFLLEIVRPEKAYVRPYIDRGTQNAVINGILAIQFHSRSRPAIQSTDIAGSVILVTPPEGTA